MSRIGSTPIVVGKDASVTVRGDTAVINGPKGELRVKLPLGITVKQEGDQLAVISMGRDRRNRALHGLIRARIAHDMIGVIQGWSKTLELSGVGYRASLTGTTLELSLGFSHSVLVVPPAGITFLVREGKITISGIDKELVGQVAAKIRALKKPEPYKGKGIKYLGESIRRKAGKAAKALGPGVGMAK